MSCSHAVWCACKIWGCGPAQWRHSQRRAQRRHDRQSPPSWHIPRGSGGLEAFKVERHRDQALGHGFGQPVARVEVDQRPVGQIGDNRHTGAQFELSGVAVDDRHDFEHGPDTVAPGRDPGQVGGRGGPACGSGTIAGAANSMTGDAMGGKERGAFFCGGLCRRLGRAAQRAKKDRDQEIFHVAVLHAALRVVSARAVSRPASVRLRRR